MNNPDQPSSGKTEPIPVTTVTFHLTEDDVARYREEIERFPLENEGAVLRSLPEKLKSMARGRHLSTFVLDLVHDVELLYEALTPRERIPDHSRKMILYALRYFVESEDEIPDSIDILGYMDDAVLIRWVVDEIKRKSPEILPDSAF
ncbi:MAG: hypothetical protein V3U24_04385 [Candidatus Neomarinimicrobiota bacterium]